MEEKKRLKTKKTGQSRTIEFKGAFVAVFAEYEFD